MVTRTQQAALNEASDRIVKLRKNISGVATPSHLSQARNLGSDEWVDYMQRLLTETEERIMDELEYLNKLETTYSIDISHSKIKQELIESLFERAGKLEQFSWQAKFGLKHGL